MDEEDEDEEESKDQVTPGNKVEDGAKVGPSVAVLCLLGRDGQAWFASCWCLMLHSCSS